MSKSQEFYILDVLIFHISFWNTNTEYVIGGLRHEHSVSLMFKVDFSKITTMSESVSYLSVSICSVRKPLHQILFSSGCFQLHSMWWRSILNLSATDSKWWIAAISWDCLGRWLPKHNRDVPSSRQPSNIPKRAKGSVSDLCLDRWQSFRLRWIYIGS